MNMPNIRSGEGSSYPAINFSQKQSFKSELTQKFCDWSNAGPGMTKVIQSLSDPILHTTQKKAQSPTNNSFSIQSASQDNVQESALPILHPSSSQKSGTASSLTDKELSTFQQDLNDYHEIALHLYQGDETQLKEIAEIFDDLDTCLASIKDMLDLAKSYTNVTNQQPQKLNEELQSLVDEFHTIQNNAIEHITTRCQHLQKNTPNQQGVAAKVASDLEGIFREAQLNSTSQVDAVFQHVISTISKASANVDESSVQTMTPQERASVYQSISKLKVMKHDLMSLADKKTTFLQRHLPSLSSNTAVLKEKKCEEYLSQVEKYLEKFHFSPDEVAQFEKASIGSKLPRRTVLVKLADDILASGEHSLRQELLRHLEESEPSLQIQNDQHFDSFLNETKDSLPPSSPSYRAISQYKSSVRLLERLKSRVAEHPSLGNGNPSEALPINSKESKKVQAEAKEQYTQIFNSIANMHSSMHQITRPEESQKRRQAEDVIFKSLEKASSEPWAKECIREITGYSADKTFSLSNPSLNLGRAANLLKKVESHELIIPNNAVIKSLKELKNLDTGIQNTINQSRESIISSSSRWDVPIDKQYSVDSEHGTLNVRYTMTCPNEGRASSAFRGRDGGVLPNFWRSELNTESGEQLFGRFGHTSSATPNEFFQLDDKKRYTATRQQCLEVLSDKAMHHMNVLDKEGRELTETSLEKPYVLHSSGVSLMTLDTVRDWLMSNEALNKTIRSAFGHGKYVDPSQLERRQYMEAHKAMASFDKENKQFKVGEFFTFTDNKGTTRTVEAQQHPETDELVYKITTESQDDSPPKILFVQFSVAYYNTGVNSWAYNVNTNTEKLVSYGSTALETASSLPGVSTLAKSFSTFGKNLNISREKRLEKRRQQFVQDFRNLIPKGSKVSDTQILNSLKQGRARSRDPQLQRRLDSLLKKAKQDLQKIEKEVITSHSGENGNILENKNNLAAFKKQSKHVEEKMATATESRLALEKQISNSTIVNGVRTQESTVTEARKKFLHYEKQIHSNLSLSSSAQNELNGLRDQALKEWTQARRDLAQTKLDIAKNKDPKVQNWLKQVSYINDLQDLHDEVFDQLQFQDHRTKEHMDRNMYAFSSALAALGILLDEDPHTHCRSGKDRTSLQRIEIQNRFLMRSKLGYFPNYREWDLYKIENQCRQQAALYSGQIDGVAEKNIGAEGLNISGGHHGGIPIVGPSGASVSNNAFESAMKGGYSSFVRSLTLDPNLQT